VFTGIIEEVGEVAALEPAGDSAVLTVAAHLVADDVRHGASIAVDGVCLTVIGRDAAGIRFDVMGETLKRSVIGALMPGERVNLERAVRADARLDGHLVQGHVDGTGTVISRTPGDAWEAVRFGLPVALAPFVAEKGSIAVSGVSLTVSAVGNSHCAGSSRRHRPAPGPTVGADWFEVGLIPETLRATTLGGKAAGDAVNLEVDVLAKYVARLLACEVE
jgi:riboflavin synthase